MSGPPDLILRTRDGGGSTVPDEPKGAEQGVEAQVVGEATGNRIGLAFAVLV
jgi:hypothetical protein